MENGSVAEQAIELDMKMFWTMIFFSAVQIHETDLHLNTSNNLVRKMEIE